MVGNKSTATETITLFDTDPPAIKIDDIAIAISGEFAQYKDMQKHPELKRAVTKKYI